MCFEPLRKASPMAAEDAIGKSVSHGYEGTVDCPHLGAALAFDARYAPRTVAMMWSIARRGAACMVRFPVTMPVGKMSARSSGT